MVENLLKLDCPYDQTTPLATLNNDENHFPTKFNVSLKINNDSEQVVHVKETRKSADDSKDHSGSVGNGSGRTEDQDETIRGEPVMVPSGEFFFFNFSMQHTRVSILFLP